MSWKIAATLPARPGEQESLGFAGAVSGFYKNRILVAGGANFPDAMPWLGGKKKYYNEVFIYLKKGDELFLESTSCHLPEAIAYSASSSCEQGIVYAGGENEKGPINHVFLIQLKDAVCNFKKLPDLPVAVSNASMIISGNKVYLAGGETALKVSDQFFLLDLHNMESGWKILPPLPKPLSHAVMVIQQKDQHENIYVLGGRQKTITGISELFNSVYEFDVTAGSWSSKSPLPYALSAGTGVDLNGEQILLLGGDNGATFHKVESIIAAIQKETDEQKKNELNRQKTVLQSSHPGFSNTLLLYDTRKGTCKSAGNAPLSIPVTTSAFKYGDQIFITSGEIRAGVRSPHIIAGKIPHQLQ